MKKIRSITVTVSNLLPVPPFTSSVAVVSEYGIERADYRQIGVRFAAQMPQHSWVAMGDSDSECPMWLLASFIKDCLIYETLGSWCTLHIEKQFSR